MDNNDDEGEIESEERCLVELGTGIKLDTQNHDDNDKYLVTSWKMETCCAD